MQEPPRRNPALGEDGTSVALSFESAALGRLDLRIDLGSGDVSRSASRRPPGRAYELADGGVRAPACHAWTAATGLRSAAVHVTPRREPLDLYA